MTTENDANWDAMHGVMTEVSDSLKAMANAWLHMADCRSEDTSAYLQNMALQGKELQARLKDIEEVRTQRERLALHLDTMENISRQNVEALAVIARALDDLAGAFVRRTETTREDGTVEVKREPEVVPVTTEGNDFLRVDQ